LSTVDPLDFTPGRQAVDPIRGYEYQIWQSVYQWISLKEDEALFLEAAEDFDVVGPARAQTNQVRRTRKPVTLVSKEILVAIGHFWEHQRRNPGVRIRFRYLTTSERRREKGVKSRAFLGQAGLDYWDRCKRPGTDLMPLKDFLSSRRELPDPLLQFIETADDATLREGLITRIDWETGQRSVDYIERAVTEKVIYHGDKNSLPPSESRKIVPHLFYQVLNTITRDPNRRLIQTNLVQ
jgi:hypothetical protein